MTTIWLLCVNFNLHITKVTAAFPPTEFNIMMPVMISPVAKIFLALLTANVGTVWA